MSKPKYYAVRKGRAPGIYSSWEECKEQVHAFPDAEYKSFSDRGEAQAFLEGTAQHAIPEDSRLMEAYVDGSFSAEKQSFSYGMVILYEGEEFCRNGSKNDPDILTMRNVAGEIWGASKAMELAVRNEVQDLVIYHDYEGVEKWCTGEWKANLPMTQAYRHYYESLPSSLHVRFRKVKSHSGNHYNDMADELAKQALGIGKSRFIWFGIDLEGQTDAFDQKVKEAAQRYRLDPPGVLPRHVSLKISFRIPPELLCPVVETSLAYFRRQKPFRFRPEKLELRKGILWIRMEDDPELVRIHRELDALLSERFGIPITELDQSFIFHSTVFMEETEPDETEEALEKQQRLTDAWEELKQVPLPEALSVDRFLVGMSELGTPDSYTVYREVRV